MEKEDRSLKLEELKKLSRKLKSKNAMSHSDDDRLHLENLTNIDGLILPKKIGDEEEFEPLDKTDDMHKTR